MGVLARSAVFVVTVGSALCFGAGVAPAMPSQQQAPFGPGRSALELTSPTNLTSTTSAGYLSPITFVKGTTTTISATVNVARVSCTGKVNGTYFEDAEISGYYRGIQVTSYSVVTASCSGNAASYLAYILTDNSCCASSSQRFAVPPPGSLPGGEIRVSPGDKVMLSGATTPGNELFSVHDTTNGATTSGYGFGFTPAGVFVGAGASGTAGGLFPKFTTTNFTSVKVNGAAIKASKPTAYNQVDANGTTQIVTSPLSDRGRAFTEKFLTNT